MSTDHRSSGCSPCMIQSASAHPAPAGRRDAEGVEAGADEDVAHLGGLAKDEVAVGGESLRPVDHLLDAGGAERRDAGERHLHVLGEMVPVVVKELEGEVVRSVAGDPRNRVRLVAAEHEAADFLLEVGAPVGIADGRHARHDPRDLFGNDILVPDRLKGDADPGFGGNLARPETGADHDLFAGDGPRRCDDAGDAPVFDVKLQAGDAFDDSGAMAAGAPRQRLGHVRGRGLPVRRHEGRPDQIAGLDRRPQGLGLGRRQQVHVEAEGPGGGRLTAELGPALRRRGEAEAPRLAPAGCKAGLGLQPFVEIDGGPQQLGDRGRRAELADQPGGVPRRAAGQLAALDQDDVGLVVTGQMIGDGAADDAAADDDDFGVGRKAQGTIPPAKARSNRSR